jgi:hypothetical protein
MDWQAKILNRLSKGDKLIVAHYRDARQASLKHNKKFTDVPVVSVDALERKKLIKMESFRDRFQVFIRTGKE